MTGIILVNFNNTKDTIECVKSLNRIDDQKYIYIIDNFSKEEEYKKLSDEINQMSIKNLELIRLNENKGFAGGNNVGITKALENEQIKYILLLNNDTVVEDDFLKPLKKAIDCGYAMATSKILFYDNKDLVWSAGGYIDKKRGIGVNRLFKSKNRDIDDSCEINFAPFCCVLFRRDVFYKEGLMDESYFMYFEDADYCNRLILNNYKMFYCSNSLIFHKVSSSTGGLRSKFYLEWMTRNRIRFINKFYNKRVLHRAKIEFFIKKIIYIIKLDFGSYKAIKRGEKE